MKSHRDAKIIHAIYIGERFYDDSGTIMSSIYTTGGGTYQRYDYGFLQVDVGEGKEVRVRPATEKELKFFTERLISIQNEHKDRATKEA